jgi:hypothetical protein
MKLPNIFKSLSGIKLQYVLFVIFAVLAGIVNDAGHMNGLCWSFIFISIFAGVAALFNFLAEQGQ